MPDPAETTRLLNRLSEGDDSASTRLWSEIHDESFAILGARDAGIPARVRREIDELVVELESQ